MVYPDKKRYTSACGDYWFKWTDRANRWLYMVSPQSGDVLIKVNQDINIFTVTGLCQLPDFIQNRPPKVAIMPSTINIKDAMQNRVGIIDTRIPNISDVPSKEKSGKDFKL